MIGAAVVVNGPMVLMTTAGCRRRISVAISATVPATTVRAAPYSAAVAVRRAASRPTSTGVTPLRTSSPATALPLRPVPPRIQTSVLITRLHSTRPVPPQ